MSKHFERGILAFMVGSALGLTCLTAAADPAADKAANERALKEARELADNIESVTQPGGKVDAKDSMSELPKGDPCALIKDAEVRKIYPKASSGMPERTREKYGILACMWDHPTGKFIVQLMKAEPKTAVVEARGIIVGFVDSLQADAEKAVRLETMRGVGDEAAAVVEQKDEKRSILGDAAYIVTQRGERQIWIMAPDLARGDRTKALKILEEWAKAAVGRL